MSKLSSAHSQQARALVMLRDLILKGAFVPGERLAEIPLAERLNTSRTPVRLALASLEYEGLVEQLEGGGYGMRGFTTEETADAIRMRGVLEGYAARRLAENGVPTTLKLQFRECLAEADLVVFKDNMNMDDYTVYVEVNNRLHSLILDNCNSPSTQRLMESLKSQPFTSPSAMLPMQSSIEEGPRWMQLAQQQHHSLVQAMLKGQGGRAQALAEEHVEIACLNLEYAQHNPEMAHQALPALRMIYS